MTKKFTKTQKKQIALGVKRISEKYHLPTSPKSSFTEEEKKKIAKKVQATGRKYGMPTTPKKEDEEKN